MPASANPLIQDDPRYYGGTDNALAPQPTWADAAQWHAQNFADTWSAMQNPQTWVDAGRQYGNALLMGTTAPGAPPVPGITAYHGSPYDFERFDTSKIGTGEGAQAYGRGLYFSEREGTAQTYRDTLATPLFGGQRYNPDNPAHRASYYVYQRNGGDRAAALRELDGEDAGLASRSGASLSPYIVAARQRIAENRALIADPSVQLPEVTNMGNMYEVNLKANPEDFMHQDKRMSDQSEQVQNAIRPLMQNNPKLQELWQGNPYGSEVYEQLARQTGQQGIDYAGASQALQDAGVPGISYLDQHSRGSGEGTSNYVVFDANTIDILRKYGIAGLIAGGGAAAAGSQPSNQ